MGQATVNSQCPLGSSHYSSCVVNTRVLVKILTELVLSLDVSRILVVRVELALFRLAHPLVRHHHPLLFICHVYIIVVVCNCHHSEKSYGQSQLQVISLCLCLVLCPRLALAHHLNFVSMACTNRLPEVSKIFQKHRYILLTIIIIVTMIMNNLT